MLHLPGKVVHMVASNSPPNQAFFKELIAQDTDITLFELRDALAVAGSVKVHHSSTPNLLSRFGFTYRWRLPGAAVPG